MRITSEYLLEELDTVLNIKLEDCKTIGYRKLTAEDIVRYLLDYKWKSEDKVELHQIVSDILNLKFSDIYDFLYNEAIIKTNETSINSILNELL